MSAIEKDECMENLKFLGAFDAVAASLVSSTSKQSNEEFTLDKPCYGTFPAILHYLFKQIDENECNRRFKESWPIVAKQDRVKFRQVALSWFQEIRKAEPPGKVPDFTGPVFDNPAGERFVKFLLGFSTYILELRCRKLQGTDHANNNGVNPPEEQFPGAVSNCATSTNLSELINLLESETQSMKEFCQNARSKIESFDQQSFQEKHDEQRQRDVLFDGLKKLALLQKHTPSEVDRALKGRDWMRFGNAVLNRAKAELDQYKAAWQNLEPLFEQCRQFDKACVLAFDQPTLNSVDVAKYQTESGQFPDVFLPDGRLDVVKLVDSLRSSVNSLLEAANEAGDPAQLEIICENGRRSGAVLMLAVQQLQEMMESLTEMVSQVDTSVTSLQASVAEQQRNRPPPSLPVWMRPVPTYKFKPMPNVDFNLVTEPKYDWSQVCSYEGSIASVNSTLTTLSIGNDQGPIENYQLSTRMVPADETIGSPKDQIDNGAPQGEHIKSSDTASIEDQRGNENDIGSASSYAFVNTPAEKLLSKHATPARKFRLSMSPYSSSASSNGMASNMKAPTRAIPTSEDDFASANASFDAGSGDSPAFDLVSSRRFSMKLQGPMLEILEDDEGSDNGF